MPPHSSPPLTRVLPPLLALLLGLALALERLGRAAADPEGVLVGEWTHPDCLGNHWLLVWVAERLLAGEGLLRNDLYYWPHGDAPWLAGNGSEGLLYLPFHVLLGWPAGVTAFLFTLAVTNTLAGYALGRAAGAGPLASLVSAAAVGSLTYVVQELGAGRFTQADVTFLTLGLAGILALRPGAGRALAVGAGLAAGAAAILYWYYGFFLILAAGVVLGLRLATRRGLPWSRLLLAGGVGLALALPVLAIYLTHWELIPGTGVEEPFPHPEAIGDSLRPEWPVGVDDGRMVSQAVPLPALVLAALALGRRLRRRGEHPTIDLALLALVVVFTTLALGTAGPLYEPLHGLAAPLRRFWWPHRYLVVAQLALAALAARGISGLRPAWLLGPALALSMSPALRLAGDPVEVHQSPVRLPPSFYAGLAALPGEVMLGLPFTPELSSTQTPLIYQLYHRKRMINGHAPWVDRVRPPAWDAMVAQNSFLEALAAYERGEDRGGRLRFDPEDLAALIEGGLAILVVDLEHYPLPARAAAEGHREAFTALFGEPALREGRARAWSTAGWTGLGDAPLRPWRWPPGMRPGGGTQALRALRAASPTFDPDREAKAPGER